MPVTHLPVFKGLAETATILCSPAQRAAHYLRPSVGSFEHPQHVGVREGHATRLGDVTDLSGIEREPLGITESANAFRNEMSHLEGRARAACDQERDLVGQFRDQTKNRRNALGIRNVVAVECKFERRAPREHVQVPHATRIRPRLRGLGPRH